MSFEKDSQLYVVVDQIISQLIILKAKIRLTENCYGKKMVIIELMQVACKKVFFDRKKLQDDSM